jgi:prophage regulatory protein
MKIMRLKDVMDTTGLARSTIYKYIGEGIFPKPVNLAPDGHGGPSTRGVGWVDAEIFDWVLARIEERDLSLGAAASCSRLSVAR